MTGQDDLADRLPNTARQIVQGLDRLHPGAQIYVSQGGATVVEAAIGVAAAGDSLTVDHRMPWLSAGKPLTAFAILQFADAGQVDLDTPVAEAIPEFASHGKQTVTLRHMLTHTAGLQPVPTGWPRKSWDEILDRIYTAKLRHGAAAGQPPAYDPQRTWFVLGEWIRRLTGLDFEAAMQSRICRPLGMLGSGWLRSSPTGPAVPQAQLHRCDETGCHPESEAPSDIAPPSPGSSFRAPARELGRFYEMLLRRGVANGEQLLSEHLVREMTTRQRVDQFDLTFQHQVDFGLGVIIDSNHHGRETVPYGFGRHCSPDTFGHGGAECAIAFADPPHELVVAVATNGRPGEAAHQLRHREICAAIYIDLGLT